MNENDIFDYIHNHGFKAGDYGGKFAWRSTGDFYTNCMSFRVIAAGTDFETGEWVLDCVDGNDREFQARAPTHLQAMYRAMGIAMGIAS